MAKGVRVQLNDKGLLPEGIHEYTLDQIREAFGTFNVSDKRPRLFQKLEDYFAELQSAQIASHLIVNGSFITDKPEPNDIDLVVALLPGVEPSKDWSPYKTNLIRSHFVRKNYGFDVFAAKPGSPSYQKYILIYSRTREYPGQKKGLVKVVV